NDEVLSTIWEMDTVSRKASSTLLMEVKPADNKAVLRCESVNQVTRSPMAITRTLTVLYFTKVPILVEDTVSIAYLFRLGQMDDDQLCTIQYQSKFTRYFYAPFPPRQFECWFRARA
ncbi:nephrin isoform X1, partial [Tachysurus ichikawai]